MTATLIEADILLAPPIEDIAPHHTEGRREQLASATSLSTLAAQALKAQTRGWKTWQRQAFEWLADDEEALDAFRRLALRMDRYQDVLSHRSLCRSGGDYGSALRGLAALAYHHRRWIRGLEEWTSKVQRNGMPQSIDQFSSLARHLLAKYHVPTFLDESWFAERSDEAVQRQGWFIHVGSGGSVRDLDTPVHLTRRMAHEFMLRGNRDSMPTTCAGSRSWAWEVIR